MARTVTSLCRDCLARAGDGAHARCLACRSPRVVAHPDLADLTIAHVDCDAFYASVEKRDRPDLADRPVIVGGGARGVVAACCYIARLYGVHSAMPMFKATQRCPDAVVLKPDMARYRREGRRIREMMRALTPLVEPLSVDEAYLDLTGTAELHGGPPAQTLAALASRVEAEVGVTVSIGLSVNKFLARIASDLDKPRGFACLGGDEAVDFLTDQPVGIVPGAGERLQGDLRHLGIRTMGDLRRWPENELAARFGGMGRRLHAFAYARDDRAVTPNAPAKSISSETTFADDAADAETLLHRLWPLCETVAGRLKNAGRAGRTVTLKLKTADFKTRTRRQSLGEPTQLAERLYRTAEPLVRAAADGTAYRLIGIGASEFTDAALADAPTLLDPERAQTARVEAAIDRVRDKLGANVIAKGRAWPPR